jgi:acyl-CoA thioesterase YciA
MSPKSGERRRGGESEGTAAEEFDEESTHATVLAEESTDAAGKGELAIRVVLLPRDTNAHGTIFGGIILSQIDLAGSVEARKHTEHPVVTVAMDKVDFAQPVFVGDVISFYARPVRKGRTSITVKVVVEAERASVRNARVLVTQAEVVYVAVGVDRRPVPLRA